MNHDARFTDDTGGRPPAGLAIRDTPHPDAPRMQYRNRPVSVAVDPISLVISECISITSAIQKHARSPHSSVSAILGGSPNPLNLGLTIPPPKSRIKSAASGVESADVSSDNNGTSNRWGLRGQKGRSMQDNPLIAAFGKLRHELAGVKGLFEIRSSRRY